MFASVWAARCGHDVSVYEKNEKLGKKIYITGKGRCNFTNDCSTDDFLLNVVRGKKFLTGVLYTFPPQKTIDFFEEYGYVLDPHTAVAVDVANKYLENSDFFTVYFSCVCRARKR